VGTIAVSIFFCSTACINAALLPVTLISFPDTRISFTSKQVLLREAIFPIQKLGSHGITIA
jgi:hypothetical protein